MKFNIKLAALLFAGSLVFTACDEEDEVTTKCEPFQVCEGAEIEVCGSSDNTVSYSYGGETWTCTDPESSECEEAATKASEAAVADCLGS
ncbi:hypothetical protein [Reichenbachiella versicolor]|uniref:hypothetical protein n=1 Tax=Reichenbachiella versicolor TaxID=1821036 RepID=UPI000D6DED79|nr:hypothetical protein [Reichenbachiella versicolor]